MRAQRWMFLALAVAFPVFAGVNRWTSTGPGEPAVSFGHAGAMRILPDPANPQTAYVTTAAGIFKTLDAGASWTPASAGLPGVAPSSDITFAIAGSTLYSAMNGQVFGSVDGGDHWLRRADLKLSIDTLAFDPTNQRLFAGMARSPGSVILFSDDGGQTWKQSSISPPVDSISSIVVGPDGTAYAGATFNGGGTFLMISNDHGQTWSLTGRLMEAAQIAVDPSDGFVYTHGSEGSVFISRNRGVGWVEFAPAGVATGLVARNGNLFVANDTGVFQYDARAKKWQPLGVSESVVAIAATFSARVRFFVATERSGVLTKLDFDTQWTRADAGLPGSAAAAVGVVPSDASTVYAAATGGLYKSSSAGEEWALLPFPTWNSDVQVSADSTPAVYANTGSIQRTTDGGLTWKRISPDSRFGVSSFAVARADGKTLYAALSEGMAKTSDGGTTWKILDTIPHDYYDFYYGFAASVVTIDPHDASHAYVGKRGGLYQTTDGGSTWSAAGSLSAIRTIAIDEADSSIAFAGTDASTGLFKTVDGGVTWTSAGLADKYIRTLAQHGASLYAGSFDGRVYRSDDRGVTWAGFDDGLSRAPVSRLDIDVSGRHLYAATGGGVYAYDIVDSVPAIDGSGGDPARWSQWMDSIANAGSIGAVFALPLLGSLDPSVRTDVTFINNHPAPQKIVVLWLPHDDGSSPAGEFHLTLPASSDNGGVVMVRGFITSAPASVVVLAVDETGNLDTNASITGSVRVWMYPSDGRAPFDQPIEAAGPALFQAHGQAVAVGLRHDVDFKTSVGIVNMSRDRRQFTVQLSGERASHQMTVAVAGFSMTEVHLPDDDYGLLSLTVSTDDSTVQWLSYGTTEDRSTGDSELFIGISVP